jgi:hypothetical protein
MNVQLAMGEQALVRLRRIEQAEHQTLVASGAAEGE